MFEWIEKMFASMIVLLLLFIILLFLAPDRLWRNESNDYLIMIEETRRNLSELSDYAENQAGLVRSTNEILSDMQKRRDELEPALNADLKAVEALFREQEKRDARNAWQERLIAFFIGVLSSVVVALLGLIIARWRQKSEKQLA
jgi:ABC-type Fe3+ transport system permease subunit